MNKLYSRDETEQKKDYDAERKAMKHSVHDQQPHPERQPPPAEKAAERKPPHKH